VAAKHPESKKYIPERPKPGVRVTPLMRHRLLSSHHRTTYLYAVLFIALVAVLGSRLNNNWSLDPSAPLGSCYRVDGILAAPGASHPSADRWYLGTTAAWLLVVLFAAIFSGSGKRLLSPKRMKWVLLLAVLHFPVHLYAVIALRQGNQAALEHEGPEEEGGGKGENHWEFGQTAAVLLLVVTLQECFKKLLEMHRFEKRVRRDAAAAQEEEKRAGTAPEGMEDEEHAAANPGPEVGGQRALLATTGQPAGET
jgi:hypothetical protein